MKKSFLNSVVLNGLMAVAVAGSLISAARAGTESSGGGDVVIFPGSGDDRVILADPLIAGHASPEVPGTPLALSPSLHNEVRRVSYILRAYGMVAPKGAASLWAEIPFVRELIADAKYYAVETMPDYRECGQRFVYSGLPEGARVEPVACTSGNVTWLRMDLFRRMSLRDQAVLLLHEGLRRLRIREDDLIHVARITQGMSVALDHLNSQLAGERRQLSGEETRLISSMIGALTQLSGAFESHFSSNLHALRVTTWSQENLKINVTPAGGGIVRAGTQVDPTAFVGIGVSVAQGSRVGANSVLIATDVCSFFMPCEIGSDVFVTETALDLGFWELDGRGNRISRLEDGAVIQRSILAAGWGVELGRGATIRDSRLRVFKLRLEEGASLENAGLDTLYRVTLARGASLRKLPYTRINWELQSPLGWMLGGFREGGLEIGAGARLDLGGRDLCETTAGKTVSLWHGQHVVARTEGDLMNLCAFSDR